MPANPLRDASQTTRWWIQLVVMLIVGALTITDLLDSSTSNTLTIIILVLVAVALVDLAIRRSRGLDSGDADGRG